MFKIKYGFAKYVVSESSHLTEMMNNDTVKIG